MSDRAKGLILALISAILYGFIPVLGKKFVSEFSPLFVAFFVTVVANCYLTLIALWRKELFHNFTHKSIVWVVLIGFLAALGSFFSFSGLSLGKALEAGFFFQFETFFAALLAYLFLKEELSKHQIIGLILMFAGAYIFTTGFSFNIRIGNVFFLGSAFVWGLNTVIIRRRTKDFSSIFLSFGRNFFSAIFLFPLALPYFSQNIQKLNMMHVFYFLLYGGVVASIVLSLYTALRYIKTAEATSFQLLIPVITAVIAFFALSERLDAVQFSGGAVILLGLFFITQIRKLRNKE